MEAEGTRDGEHPRQPNDHLPVAGGPKCAKHLSAEPTASTLYSVAGGPPVAGHVRCVEWHRV